MIRYKKLIKGRNMQSRFELFTLLISKISREIKKIKTKEVEEYSLSGSHVTIIYFLKKYNRLTLKELSQACVEDKAGISRLVDSLKKKGLLQNSTDNGYKQKLMLNEKGELVANEICKKIDDIVELASKGISQENREIMYECLNTICKNLENMY